MDPATGTAWEREVEEELPADMEELRSTVKGGEDKRYTVPPPPPPKTPRTMEHLRRQGSLRSEYSTASSSSGGSVGEKAAEDAADPARESQILPPDSPPAYSEPVVSAPVNTAPPPQPILRPFPTILTPPKPPTAPGIAGLPSGPKPPTPPSPPQPPTGALPHPLRSQSVWGPGTVQPPQRPASPPRPMTASTRRLTFSTLASTGSTSKKTVKYSKRGIELVPQPSDDPEDPLNWKPWRKHLALLTMLLALSVANAAKTFMLPLISPVAMALTKSYTSAAALTGAPLMVSAGSALVAPMLARGWGRRPVMLGALGCMFFGSTWNAGGSAVRVGFPQLMAGRVFQGLGWGALDAMVMAGIRDIYFDHELPQIAAATRLLGLVTTWLPPLVSGLVAQSSGTIFSRSFAALAALSGLAWLLVGLALPETMFDRSGSGMLPTPSSLYRPSQPLKPRRSFPFVSREDMLSYAREMRVVRYDGYHDLHTLIQPLRAAAAPTTLLLFLAGLLPGTALWGLAASLSLLFAPLPFMLSAADVGLMLAGVFGLPLLVTAVLSMPNPWWDVVGWAPVRRQQRPWAGAFRRFARRIAGGRAPGNDGFDRRINVLLIAVGSSLALAGCIGFGAHAADCMLSGQDASVVAEEEPVPADEVPANLTAVAAMFAVDGEAVRHLSLPLLSVLLGLLATGVAVLDATSAPLIQRSAAFTSSTLAVGQRSIADMGAGLAAWKALVAGVAVVAVPNGVWWWEGLRTTVIGLGVGQVFVAVGVGVMWWAYEERTRRLDGRVMGLVDLEELKRTGSFFDPD